MKRGRKLIYLTEEERELAAMPIAGLIREISQISGLSSNKLAQALESDISLSGDTIRQYARGKKPVSEMRLLQIAKAALKHGWIGATVLEILDLSPFIDYAQNGTQPITANFRSQHKYMQAAEKAAIKKLRDAISTLSALDWKDCDIVAAAALISAQTIDPAELTYGGLLSIAKMNKINSESNQFHQDIWMTWDFKQLSQVTPKDLETKNPKK